MTQQRGNELIAKFMGGVYREVWIGGEPITELFLPGAHITEGNPDLFYHESWNQLMPVVEKIWGMGYMIHVQYYQIEAATCTCRIYSAAMHLPSWIGSGKTPISSYYEAILQFILWHNEQTTSPTLTAKRTPSANQ